MVKKILVPLDGSKASEEALPWALELASKMPAEIILLRVGREPAVEEGMTAVGLDAFLKEQESHCRQYLDDVRSRLKSESSLPIRTEYRSGRASQEIVAQAAELQIGMIVMNSHGRDGLARWWMGSVAEKVTRHSPCPVLLVRGQAGVADQARKRPA